MIKLTVWCFVLHVLWLRDLTTLGAADFMGGDVSSSLTLSEDAEAYNITQDIIVLPGVTLFINPGVLLRFNEAGLIVQGTVRCQGNEVNHVVMEAAEGATWTGLTFEQTSEGTPESVLTYTEIDGGQILIASPSPPQMSRVNITDSPTHGISYTGDLNSTFTLDHVVIAGSVASAIRLKPSHRSSPAEPIFDISDSVFRDSGGTGVYFEGTRGLRIRNCSFTSNNGGVYAKFKGADDSSEVSNAQGPSVVITGNTFDDTTNSNEAVDLRLTRVAMVTFADNVVTMNTAGANHVSVIKLYMDGEAEDEFTVIIRGNIITNNLARRLLSISSETMTTRGRITIEKNIIKNNLNHTQGSKGIELNTFGSITILQNIFSNDGFDCELQTSDAEGHEVIRVIKATYNYWGGDAYSRISSFYTDMERSLVDIWPYYSDEDLTEISLVQYDQDSLFSDPMDMGGELRGDFILDDTTSPFMFKKGVYIPEGSSLTIRQAELQFGEDIGILAVGRLCFESGELGDVVLTKEPSQDYWHGITIHGDAFCTCCDISNLVLNNSDYGFKLFGVGASFTLTGLSITTHAHGEAAVETRASSTRVINSRISGRFSDGIRALADSQQLVVENVTMETLEYGVDVRSSVAGAVIFIRSSSFSNMDSQAVVVRGNFTGLLVQESAFISNYQHIEVTAAGNNSVILSENDFADLSPAGHDDAGVIVHTVESVAEICVCNNSFHDHVGAAPLQFDLHSEKRLQVAGNVFADNQNSGGVAGVKLEFYKFAAYYEPGGYTHDVTGNDFARNSAARIVEISVGSQNFVVAPNIRGNNFVNNTATEAVIWTSTWRGEIRDCVFSNPASNHDIKADFASGSSLNAVRNRWDYGESVALETRVYDNADDSMVGRIIYRPTQSDPETTVAVTDPEVTTVPSSSPVADQGDTTRTTITGLTTVVTTDVTEAVTMATPAVNRHDPACVSDPVVTVQEGITKQELATVLTFDDDGDDVFYNLIEEPSAFGVEIASGKVSLNRELDRETDEILLVEIKATDSGTPPRSTTCTVSVVVTDSNDNSPVFAKQEDQVTLTRWNAQGQTDIYKVTASDADEGENAKITYTLSSGASLFTINSLTGLISMETAVLPGTYSLTVTATDGGDQPLFSTMSLAVIIRDSGTEVGIKSKVLVFKFVLDMTYKDVYQHPGNTETQVLTENLKQSFLMVFSILRRGNIFVTGLSEGSLVVEVSLESDQEWEPTEQADVMKTARDYLDYHADILTIGTMGNVSLISAALLVGDNGIALDEPCSLYDAHRICQNGGTCEIKKEQPTCKCTDGYTGYDCSFEEGSSSGANQTILLIVLPIVGVFVIIFLIICVWCYRNRNKARKDEKLKHPQSEKASYSMKRYLNGSSNSMVFPVNTKTAPAYMYVPNHVATDRDYVIPSNNISIIKV